jgi:vacuolar-type H+-ATPase subunit E/Vma4
MNSPIPKSALDSQAQALLQRVTEDRDRRCAALRAAAEAQATQIVRSARAEVRSNVHRAVIQERGRMDLGMRQATARADIEVRRRERQKSRELLEQMWAAIANVLEARWREPALRRAWIDAVMSQAGELLSGRAWLIEAGADWTEQERGELGDRARGRGAATVEYSVQAALPAGLKIRAGSVCVDATVPGLLTQREAIEAAFLAEYMPVLAASEPKMPGGPAPPPGSATEKRTNG